MLSPIGVFQLDEKTVADLFKKNIMCSQIVFSEFSQDLGVSEDQAKKIASLFGLGMLAGEVCGAFTGALMVIGLKYGHCKEGDLINQTLATAKYAEFRSRFETEFGSTICCKVMGYNPALPEDMVKIEQENLFETLCPKVVCRTIELLKEL